MNVTVENLGFCIGIVDFSDLFTDLGFFILIRLDC